MRCRPRPRARGRPARGAGGGRGRLPRGTPPSWRGLLSRKRARRKRTCRPWPSSGAAARSAGARGCRGWCGTHGGGWRWRTAAAWASRPTPGCACACRTGSPPASRASSRARSSRRTPRRGRCPGASSRTPSSPSRRPGWTALLSGRTPISWGPCSRPRSPRPAGSLGRPQTPRRNPARWWPTGRTPPRERGRGARRQSPAATGRRARQLRWPPPLTRRETERGRARARSSRR